MAARLPSQLGTIDISEGVIAKIAGVNATECFGVLGLAASDGWSRSSEKGFCGQRGPGPSDGGRKGSD